MNSRNKIVELLLFVIALLSFGLRYFSFNSGNFVLIASFSLLGVLYIIELIKLPFWSNPPELKERYEKFIIKLNYLTFALCAFVIVIVDGLKISAHETFFLVMATSTVFISFISTLYYNIRHKEKKHLLFYIRLIFLGGFVYYLYFSYHIKFSLMTTIIIDIVFISILIYGFETKKA